VHLAYLFLPEQLADGGIAGAVDLAAPISTMSAISSTSLTTFIAGPMVTNINGYPTQSWGANGYGLQVANAPEAGERECDFALAECQLLQCKRFTLLARE
jgi:hypothetical protein